MYMFELKDRFFKFEKGCRRRCKLPGHDLHWVDEVRDGEWYFHGRLIAKYEPPNLWLSHAGFNNFEVERRLNMLAHSWYYRSPVKYEVDVFVYPFIALLRIREASYPRYEKDRIYVLPEYGVTLAPKDKNVEVFPQLRRVIRASSNEIEEFKQVNIRRVGKFYLQDETLYIKWGNFLFEVTVDEVKNMVKTVLGEKSKIAKLISKASTPGELVALLALLR